jgi:integrase
MSILPFMSITTSPWVDWLVTKLILSIRSVASLELIRTCFSGPLSIAVFRELIPANPASGILKQMGYSRKKERGDGAADVKFHTPEQINGFLATCRKEWPEYQPLFQFLFMTGTRLGEALAVTWKDVNWKDKTVSIDKSFRRTPGSTKTGGAKEIDLPNALLDTLKPLKKDQKKEALKTGSKPPAIIFHRGGKHMPQNHARRVYKRILAKAELPVRRIHDIRHSYASLMLKNGASLDYVKRMLGHSDISMTSNIYGHLMPNRDRSQVNLLGDTLLNPSAPNTHPENKKVVTP